MKCGDLRGTHAPILCFSRHFQLITPDFRIELCWDVQITVGNNWCTLVADAANRDEIQMRIAQIKKELSETDSVYDTEKLSERIAKLAGGVAVIKVSTALMAWLLFAVFPNIFDCCVSIPIAAVLQSSSGT